MLLSILIAALYDAGVIATVYKMSVDKVDDEWDRKELPTVRENLSFITTAVFASIFWPMYWAGVVLTDGTSQLLLGPGEGA